MGLRKKIVKKLTNRYDTQSAQSNAGKQSWSIIVIVVVVVVIVVVIIIIKLFDYSVKNNDNTLLMTIFQVDMG